MARTSKSRLHRRAHKRLEWIASTKDAVAGYGAIGVRSSMNTSLVMGKAHTAGCHVPFPHVRPKHATRTFKRWGDK